MAILEIGSDAHLAEVTKQLDSLRSLRAKALTAFERAPREYTRVMALTEQMAVLLEAVARYQQRQRNAVPEAA